MLVDSQRVAKPWGFEVWWAHTDLYAGKILHVDAGHRLSLQYHREKDESCYLLAGRVRLVTGSNVHDLTTVELGPTACWRNRPGEVHTIEAVETSEILEVSTPQLDDVVRLLDDYGRSGANGQAQAQRDARPHPRRLVDLDQVAAKLAIPRDRARHVASEPTFPPPAAYFRGRMLWEEATIDALLQSNTPADTALPLPA